MPAKIIGTEKIQSDTMLLNPFVASGLTFHNRMVMAPMSRRRSPLGVPGPGTITYYGQRASAGLIITENTVVAPNGTGILHTPGIYNTAQQAGWKKVVKEVHARKGKIFVQLVHAGRVGHSLNNEGQTALVAPSPLRINDKVRTPGNIQLPMAEPEELTTTGARAMIQAHIQAAVNAMETGFDGVEIHGAHGFLPDQFLNPNTNHRKDRYGGSPEGRSSFLLEIMEGVTAAIGKERTGIRLSPFSTVNDMLPYGEEMATHLYLTDALQQLDILYLHLSNQFSEGRPSIPPPFISEVRKRFSNLLILAGGYTADSGEAILKAGQADLIAFGRPFIANPDLVERFRHNTPLALADQATFYEGGEEGYTDYPAIHSEDSLIPIKE
ncbi:alkene reductase [Flavitalea flava]